MKKIKKKVSKIETIEPLFKKGDVVMLNDNLLMVEIGDVKVIKNQYRYLVRYSHKRWEDNGCGWFPAYESELRERPLDYGELVFEKYIEYRSKYENLLRQLARGYRSK